MDKKLEKTVKISSEIHNQLMFLKRYNNFKNLDEVISDLIKREDLKEYYNIKNMRLKFEKH